MNKPRFTFFTKKILLNAVLSSLKKLDPITQIKNPIMFVVYLGSIAITIIFLLSYFEYIHDDTIFVGKIAIWLWFTLLFANFSDAIAENKAKSQADSLHNIKKDSLVKILKNKDDINSYTEVSSTQINKGDIVLLVANDIIPCDGTIIVGCASVDESAITGESAPVIRESGGDFSSVTGGTKVLSDWIVIEVAVNQGEGFLDRMISMIEHAKRKKTPNEVSLTILLITLTAVFTLVTATLLPFSAYSVQANHTGTIVSVSSLIALLVCLIPTTIGALLPAIGIAGIYRMMQANVIAISGRAIEAAGDIRVVLFDKTGTITYGNRQAKVFHPLSNTTKEELIESAYLSSLSDDTLEGRSIVELALSLNSDLTNLSNIETEFIPFTAQTRMSGVNLKNSKIRKGAYSAILTYLDNQLPANILQELKPIIDKVASNGYTPILVVRDHNVLGVIELRDVVKQGIKEEFLKLRSMGISTVMITGDNALTAATIAAEVGVDSFLSEASPEAKLDVIRNYQESGLLVAMTGDGTNDAPAMAQADVAVAMNSGTQAAKDSANMVDLDSSPTKLVRIIEIGKQMLMTRGALTTFSIANDVAKYFTIIPAIFYSTYPSLNQLNILKLSTPNSAILSAVIFNAIIIILLIPLALRGVKFTPMSADRLLRYNSIVYGIGGLIVPFIGIKVIDIIIGYL